MKLVETLIMDVVIKNKSKKSSNIHSVSIDIYGPIFDEYEQEFEEKLKVNEFINYRGIL